ncbi:MAG: hypothetical protein FJ088_00765, partial [Deltaproteobacteria bacterium]|nr:hypothetical protein [Deltaproteobacteria bacterium]
SHVLFSNKPSETLIVELGRGRGQSLNFLVETGMNISSKTLFNWLYGSKSPDAEASGAAFANIFEAVTPDFGWEAGNQLAVKADPVPFIVTGVDCTYARRFTRNPVFDGIPLEDCERPYACSFCTKPPDVKPWETAPAELLERQLKALMETHPRFPGRPKIRITGDQIFFNVGKFPQLIKSLAFPPADFLFDTRADLLVKFESRLARALGEIAGTGHKIHICLIGIENFSKPELDRMNKGNSPAINLNAVETLIRLERENMETFNFREYGGLSMIMFSPWTTLEDLLLNLSIVREFGLEELGGKFFNSRLRLYEGLGITALARHHGLLIERYDDPALDTARRNFYPDEIPWRFRHEEVAPVNSILTRIDVDEGLKDDILYKKVQETLIKTRTEPDRLEFSLAVIAAAINRRGRKTSVANLLRETEGLLRQKNKHGITRFDRQEEEPAFEAGNALSMLPLDLKPVFLFEPVGACDVEEVKNKTARIFKKIVVRKRQDKNSGATFQVFAGDNQEEVDEAAHLIDKYENGGLDAGSESEALKGIGRLLGYPECCVDAFAGEDPDFRRMNERLHLARRISHGGAVHPGFNPFIDLLWYVPCSLACAKSIDIIDKLLARYRRILNETEYETLISRASHPHLFLLDRPAQNLEMVPLEENGNVIKFKAGRISGDDPRLKRAANGDTAVMEEGRITILAGEKILECLCVNAYVWSVKRAFFPEFWGVWRKFKRSRVYAAGRPGTVRDAAGSDESERLFGKISAALERGGVRTISGFEVASIESTMENHIFITLKKGGDIVKLIIEERARSEKCYLETENYAISYRRETPVDTGEKAAAVRALAEMLG